MKPPTSFTRIVNRRRYSVENATLLASDCYWDGHNWERYGRNTFLYRTPAGNYFTVTLTVWQGEENRLEPVTVERAMELYWGPLREHEVAFEQAFPGVAVEEA